jgi:type I pantothenate kinase
VWDSINGPNLVEHILPTRPRADLVLRKADDHTIRSVLLRKV